MEGDTWLSYSQLVSLHYWCFCFTQILLILQLFLCFHWSGTQLIYYFLYLNVGKHKLPISKIIFMPSIFLLLFIKLVLIKYSFQLSAVSAEACCATTWSNMSDPFHSSPKKLLLWDPAGCIDALQHNCANRGRSETTTWMMNEQVSKVMGKLLGMAVAKVVCDMATTTMTTPSLGSMW